MIGAEAALVTAGAAAGLVLQAAACIAGSDQAEIVRLPDTTGMKNELIGLVTALEQFLAEDEEAEMRHYRQVCERIVDALIEVPWIRAVVEHDPVSRVVPHAVVYFEQDWVGPPARRSRRPWPMATPTSTYSRAATSTRWLCTPLTFSAARRASWPRASARGSPGAEGVPG